MANSGRLKILEVHNDYGAYSGEEAVVDRMIADFRSMGHEVVTLRRTSEGLRDSLFGKIKGFFAGIYSFSGRRQMRRMLDTFKPDLVHIHNLYPFISPAVLFLCKDQGCPVIMTVHNYRLICPTGLFLRNGKPCENCLTRGNERNCIRYNCEHSHLRSLGYALRNMVARKTRAYMDCVDYFCCLTNFQRQKLIAAGFAPDKLRVFPNYIEYVEPVAAANHADNNNYVGYVGRLSPEKGFDMLMEVARRHPEIPFRFAGLQREGTSVESLPNVVLCGQLNRQELADFYAEARFIVIPSRCYEGFPVALLEASSYKRCCIAPRHGAFPDLMTDGVSEEPAGLLFNPLDVDDLERQVVGLWSHPDQALSLGIKAEQNYRTRFLKEKTKQSWATFLDQVVTNKTTFNTK